MPIKTSTAARAAPRTSASAAALDRRRLLLGACALPWLNVARAEGADERYPDKPVRLIVPYTAGSVGDLFVRHLAELMRRRLGAVFVADNRPGASQSIGADAVAKSPPDGYTLFLGSQSGLVLNTLARKKLPYDPLKDFAPISMLFTAPMYLFVNPKVQANRVQDLVAVAKANPGKLTFASIGPGTSSHLAGEMLKAMAGIDMLHVPYRGGPEATTALITGEVDVMFNGGNVLPQLMRGKVRAIGIGSSRRVASMPELPTLKESGLPDFDVSPWFAMFAPAATPRPILLRLNKEVVALLKEPALKERAVSLSLEIEPSSPEQLGQSPEGRLPGMGESDAAGGYPGGVALSLSAAVACVPFDTLGRTGFGAYLRANGIWAYLEANGSWVTDANAPTTRSG